MSAVIQSQSPIRTKARGLLRRFLDRVELECEKAKGDIPEITNGQWRTVSAVLATYRMMVDEQFQEAELELARFDYSKLTIEELRVIKLKYQDHPALAGINGGEEAIDAQGSNDG